METRNILDYQGNVIGQLELPENTSEEVWAKKLAIYAVDPNPTLEYQVQLSIVERKKFADQLMEEFKRKNILEGINGPQALWAHHRMRAVELNVEGLPITIDLLNLVVSGDMEVALFTLQHMEADDMSEAYHWWSSERIAWLAEKVAGYIG